MMLRRCTHGTVVGVVNLICSVNKMASREYLVMALIDRVIASRNWLGDRTPISARIQGYANTV